MLQRTLWGPLTKEENRGLKDLSAREVWTLAPLCVLMLWIGVAPETFLRPSRAALDGLLSAYQQRIAAPVAEAPALLPAAAPREAAR
jgi:NADH-quinone oxidoreductase subunit M